MTPQHETSNNLGTNNHTNDTAIPTPTIQLGTAAPQESQIANNESLDSNAGIEGKESDGEVSTTGKELHIEERELRETVNGSGSGGGKVV
jgi:hypothetical protein